MAERRVPLTHASAEERRDRVHASEASRPANERRSRKPESASDIRSFRRNLRKDEVRKRIPVIRASDDPTQARGTRLADRYTKATRQCGLRQGEGKLRLTVTKNQTIDHI